MNNASLLLYYGLHLVSTYTMNFKYIVYVRITFNIQFPLNIITKLVLRVHITYYSGVFGGYTRLYGVYLPTQNIIFFYSL